jgi:murein L,D-transpeptidase YcbB/YkuD
MVPSVMMKVSFRSVGAACVLAALLLASGCHRHRKSKSAPNTDAYSDKLHQLVEKKALPPEKVDTSKVPNLRWPNFSDYQTIVSTFYDDRNYEVAWTRDGAPTATATAFIKQFQDAAAKGLIPEDYDASRWAGRVQELSSKSADAISLFDVAMTVNVLRYISDLHIGRVNPSHFNFEIPVQDKKYDLAEFVSDNAVDSTDVPKLIAGIEPDSDEYRKTEQALAHYLDLAKQQEQANADPLPMVTKAVSVGDPYPSADTLFDRLELEGDTAGGAAAAGSAVRPQIFDSTLSDSVKSYQHRHGIAEDGKLTPQTIKSLNVPMTDRVAQLEDSLERWRWLPDPYLHSRLMVNLPEFVLRGYDPDHKLDFTMRVVDGQVKGGHETPVFTHMMKYLVFRPYWSVPVDIARKELVPHIEANRGYLASKNFEVTNNKGVVLTDYTAKQVAQGAVMVREKPGPKNSLGLVKFIFPNQYDIYLHSTPAVSLFDRPRRDFSHGCIRVQKPVDLAAWVLQDQGDWDLDKVQEAMNNGSDNKTVSLKTPLPITIFYLTAIVEDDGQVHFFDDIYGYDSDMQKVFANGPPYPVKPEPIVPKTKPGETV